MGRPSKFKTEFVDQARKLCELGATDEEVAGFFEVDVRTLYRWQTQYEEFCQALKTGKSASDERVERSLFHRAVGYSFASEKIFHHQGAITRADFVEHVPPDTTAAIFWLKNRKPKEWRDVNRTEHTGPDGAPIQVSTRERAKAIASLIEKVKRGRPEGA